MYHLFVLACYTTPLLGMYDPDYLINFNRFHSHYCCITAGAVLADGRFGKYRTILYLSVGDYFIIDADH
jgi:hypothetical protein